MSTRKVLVMVNGNTGELPTGDIGDFGYPTHTHKNWLINGDFRIWQRGTSFNPTTSGKTYTADRWCYNNSSTPNGMAINQLAFGLGQAAVPNNPAYYLEASQGLPGSSSFHAIEQRIEDVRNFSGLNVTLSFWASADTNRTLNTQFTQCFGSGGSPSPNNVTVAQANYLNSSWQFYTHQVLLPSISGATLGSNNDHYLAVQFALPLNTSFLIYLANIQLELGYDATDFQRRLIGHEFALCQRYFQRAGKRAPFIFFSSTEGIGHLALPVALRTSYPALSLTTTQPYVEIPGTNRYSGSSSGAWLNPGSNGSTAQFEYGLAGFSNNPLTSTPALLYDDYLMLDAEL